MTPWQTALAHAVKVLVVLILIGLLVRGRWRQSWPFVVYLTATLTGNTLISVWPERFYFRWFWILKEVVYAVLKLVLALHLAHRALRVFPGAAFTARVLACLVLVMTSLAVLRSAGPLASPGEAEEVWLNRMLEWQPRVQCGAILLMTAIAVLVEWYRIPIEAFQRALLLGFSAYLVVFTTVLNILREHQWAWGDAFAQLRAGLSAVDAVAYVALLAWWAYAAWRQDEVAVVSPELARRLRLEHA